jgi:uroporphyrinogen-III synthase
MSFAGLKVLSLETRRAKEMETLIRRMDGDVWIAPSVRERATEENPELFAWAEKLFAGEFDMVIFMTGVGLTYMRDAIVTKYPVEEFTDALRKTTIVSRGPKPLAILHEMGVKPQIRVAEPNTWKEIVPVVALRPERRIAIQEYGKHNVDFEKALQALGATVHPVAVYRWEMPEDLEPLRESARRLAAGGFDVVIFTTSIQLVHLLEIARDMGIEGQVRKALQEQTAIASVGPIMNAALAEHGFEPDIVPVHPKMGVLVRAAAEQAATVLQRKRTLPEPQAQ